MAPLPATSQPAPALAASSADAYIWDTCAHSQAISLYLADGVGSLLPDLPGKVSPFLPALLSNVDASIRSLCLEPREICLPFMYPSICHFQHEWILSCAGCKSYPFKTIPHETHSLVKNTYQKPIREATNHDGIAGVPNLHGGKEPTLSMSFMCLDESLNSNPLDPMPVSG